MERLSVALVIIAMDTQPPLEPRGKRLPYAPCVTATATRGNTIIQVTREQEFHHQVSLLSYGSRCVVVLSSRRRLCTQCVKRTLIQCNGFRSARLVSGSLNWLWPHWCPAGSCTAVYRQHTQMEHTHIRTLRSRRGYSDLFTACKSMAARSF